MNRQLVYEYLKRKQKDWDNAEHPDIKQQRYCTGYASALFESANLVKNMDLPVSIREWLKKSGYPIVNMDQAVASVEKVMLKRLDDIMDMIWDDVDGDPDFLRSCNFNR